MKTNERAYEHFSMLVHGIQGGYEVYLHIEVMQQSRIWLFEDAPSAISELSH